MSSCFFTQKNINDNIFKVLYYSSHNCSKLNLIDSGYIKKTKFKNNTIYNYYQMDTTLTKYSLYKHPAYLLLFDKKINHTKNYSFIIECNEYNVEKYEFIDSNNYDNNLNYYFNIDFGLLIIHDISWGLFEYIKYKNNITQNILVDSIFNKICIEKQRPIPDYTIQN